MTLHYSTSRLPAYLPVCTLPVDDAAVNQSLSREEWLSGQTKGYCPQKALQRRVRREVHLPLRTSHRLRTAATASSPSSSQHSEAVPDSKRQVREAGGTASPEPALGRLAVRVAPRAEQYVRAGHPWVFASSVTSVKGGKSGDGGVAGQLAVIFDRRKRFLAVGLYDPNSPIAVRILHTGTPTPVDDQFWAAKFTRALARRKALMESTDRDAAPVTNGFRCIHGESDGFPGLVLDRYDKTLVVKIYSAAWIPHLPTLLPIFRQGVPRDACERVVLRQSRHVARAGRASLAEAEARLQGGALAPLQGGGGGATLPGVSQDGARRVHGWRLPVEEALPSGEDVAEAGGVGEGDGWKSSDGGAVFRGLGMGMGEEEEEEEEGPGEAGGGGQQGDEDGGDVGRVIWGKPLDGCITFRENGLWFEADVLQGQKTGFFLDQRENRAAVEGFAGGASVLNVFSFTGGFSLYAARGGAKQVTSLDISGHALEGAARNFALNKKDKSVSRCEHECVQAEAFKWLAQNKAPLYDVVVLDPPAFAKRPGETPGALVAYRKLAALGARRVRPGGMLVAASCSAHVQAEEFFQAVQTGVQQACQRPIKVVKKTGQPIDHDCTDFEEQKYLKCIYLRL
eukprot:jgi/Mesvir1/20703/Mv14901-RA.2